MIKKFHTLLFACMVCAGTVSAQQGDLKYGIKAGLNFASFGYDGATKASLISGGSNTKLGGVTTFHLGGYAEYFIQDNISVQGGLSFSGNGGKQEDSGSYMGSSYSGKDKTSLMYLTVPVNLMYHLDKMYFGAGPYIGFALSGKIKSTSTIDGDTETEEDSIEFGNDSSADMKSADFGLNLQAGYKIQDNINVGLGYSLGLSNLSPSGTGSIKNRAFSISVGYSF